MLIEAINSVSNPKTSHTFLFFFFYLILRYFLTRVCESSTHDFCVLPLRICKVKCNWFITADVTEIVLVARVCRRYFRRNQWQPEIRLRSQANQKAVITSQRYPNSGCGIFSWFGLIDSENPIGKRARLRRFPPPSSCLVCVCSRKITPKAGKPCLWPCLWRNWLRIVTHLAVPSWEERGLFPSTKAGNRAQEVVN